MEYALSEELYKHTFMQHGVLFVGLHYRKPNLSSKEMSRSYEESSPLFCFSAISFQYLSRLVPSTS